jgi:hypothetical protein
VKIKVLPSTGFIPLLDYFVSQPEGVRIAALQGEISFFATTGAFFSIDAFLLASAAVSFALFSASINACF